MMTVTLTCEECGSAINVLPNKEVSTALCQVCDTQREVYFNEEHEKGNVYDCPSCQRKDFYKQDWSDSFCGCSDLSDLDLWHLSYCFMAF